MDEGKHVPIGKVCLRRISVEVQSIFVKSTVYTNLSQ